MFTFSFLSFACRSVVHEEMADRDSDLLAEAHRRRSSNASSGAGSTENQHHVTGFLASQTLALFLAVPNIQSSSNTSVR